MVTTREVSVEDAATVTQMVVALLAELGVGRYRPHPIPSLPLNSSP